MRCVRQACVTTSKQGISVRGRYRSAGSDCRRINVKSSRRCYSAAFPRILAPDGLYQQSNRRPRQVGGRIVVGFGWIAVGGSGGDRPTSLLPCYLNEHLFIAIAARKRTGGFH